MLVGRPSPRPTGPADESALLPFKNPPGSRHLATGLSRKAAIVTQPGFPLQPALPPPDDRANRIEDPSREGERS